MVDIKDLKEFCAKAKKIVKNRSTLPILDYVLIKNGEMIVTDLEVSLVQRIEGLEDITCTILFSDLVNIVNNLKNDAIKISPRIEVIIEKNRQGVDEECRHFFVDILCSKGIFKFENLSPDDFPMIPDNFIEEIFEQISSNDLDLINKANRYLNKNNLRPILNNIFIGNEIASTNEKTLAFYKRESVMNEFLLLGNVIPLLDNEVLVYQSIDKNNIKLINRINSISVIFRQDKENYPSYKNIIPSIDSSILNFIVYSEDLKELLNLCSITKNKYSRFIKFENNIELEYLSISSIDYDSNKQFNGKINIESKGENCVFGFDLDILLNIINTEKEPLYLFRMFKNNGIINKCIINDNILTMCVNIN